MTPDEAADAQRQMWTLGDYAAVAERLLPISKSVVSELPITAGTRLLDVAVGDGNAAIEAARRGARVTGIDLTPAQIDKARARVAAAGLDIDLHVGDAERLPFAGDSFDVVTSVMGVIFAPDHRRAASELARVVRPGGTVAITSWAESGWGVTWRRRAAELLPPAPPEAPSPDTWGDPVEAVRRLQDVGLVAVATVRPFAWEFPSSRTAVEFFVDRAGPFVMFMAAAEAAGKGDAARRALQESIDEANVAADGCAFDAPYVSVIASRPR